MTDREALFAAVVAEPEDDLPRLVFADYLDDTGVPADAARAAYIRTQIEAEKHAPRSAGRLECNRQAAEFRDRFKDEWDLEFADPIEWFGFTALRRRGFVEEVAGTLGRVNMVGMRMFACAPISGLRVTDARPDDPPAWQRFRTLPFLSRVRSLTLGPYLPGFYPPRPPNPGDGDGVVTEALLRSSTLTGLRSLALPNNALDDAWVLRFAVRFAAAPFASTLEALDLSHNPITDAGANALATAPGFDRLQELILSGTRISTATPMLRRRFGPRVRV